MGCSSVPMFVMTHLMLIISPSSSLFHEASWIELFVCSLVCPRADCAHFVVLIVRSSPAWHTNARRARRRARRRLHRTSFVVTALDLSALRRLREHHGSQPPRMAWTCVCCHTENAAYRRKCGNSECRFPGGPPEAWEEKHGKDKRRDKSYPPKHTWHCGECGVDNSSRRWSCSSCGAKPPGSGVSSAAAQPKRRPVSQRQNFAEAVAQERRRVKAVLPVESRSQPDSELTDVKLDEDLNQDRDKCNSKEVANKLKDLDTLIRQLQPCAKDDRVAALLEEKKQERDELKIQLQSHKPLHQRLRLATEARAKASKALEIAKKEEADIAELLALKRAEVDQFKATLLQHNNNVELLEQRYRTETGSADLGQFEVPGFQTMAPLSPSQWAAGFRNCLNSQAREVFDTFCKELEHSPDSERGLPDETPVPAPAQTPESSPAAVGAFAPFPRPRPTRVDPYQTPTPS